MQTQYRRPQTTITGMNESRSGKQDNLQRAGGEGAGGENGEKRGGAGGEERGGGQEERIGGVERKCRGRGEEVPGGRGVDWWLFASGEGGGSLTPTNPHSPPP